MDIPANTTFNLLIFWKPHIKIPSMYMLVHFCISDQLLLVLLLGQQCFVQTGLLGSVREWRHSSNKWSKKTTNVNFKSFLPKFVSNHFWNFPKPRKKESFFILLSHFMWTPECITVNVFPERLSENVCCYPHIWTIYRLPSSILWLRRVLRVGV